MAINIIKSSEAILTENLIVVLYGEPGSGKTSLAFSASNPLLLDFDLGSQRALNRKDVVRVKQWKDIENICAADLEGFDTIIIDTAGRLLEIMSAHLMSTNSKLINYSNGGLSLQGYGALSNMFKNFLLKIKSFSKDIILLAHAVEEKKNEKDLVRIDAVGSTKEELKKIADLLGYIGLQGEDRFLTFNPSAINLGKNCAEIPNQVIPNLKNNPSFLADLITLTKIKMNEKNENQIKAEQKFQEILNEIKASNSLEEINNLVASLKDGDKIHKQALRDHAVSLGFVLNKSTKQFEAPAEVKND